MTNPTPLDRAIWEEVEWRDIATAPKDGTMIDLLIDGRRYTSCYFRNEGFSGWCQDHGYPRQTRVFLKPPSHWIPLPKLPAAIRKDQP